MTSKKPEWFELTEGKSPSAGIRKINKKLPIATLVTAGAIILGGSIFATAQDEPSAVADTPVVSQSMAAAQISAPAISNNANSAPAQTLPSAKISSSLNSLPMPVVSNVPQRGDDDDDREGKHDRDDRDHDDDDDEDDNDD
ncbi:hypothetical protein [Candidatus Planktophila dulcis]|uniref:hypothetical protein n=1 Tax=Candidatus Planktophila dulcis TaxID=1884914 RepID=UPI003CF62F05